MQSLNKIHAWAQMKVPLWFCNMYLRAIAGKTSHIKIFFVVQNDLDPDQGRCRVGSDMSPSCFQRKLIRR